MTALREHRIDLPHGSLTALQAGRDDLPPLLMLHGWLDNAASFARLMPLLSAHYRVIALDLPGHGHADHLPAGVGYHLVDYIHGVLAAADALKLTRFSLLGHSLGAGIATLVAAAQPDRIQNLLLIEGLGPLGDDGEQTLRRFRGALETPREPRKPLRVFADIEQAVNARSLASGLPPPLARPIVERGLKRADGGWQWRSDPRLTRPSAVRLAESQMHALLRGIQTPTALLLARPATPYLPDAMMRARAACVKDIAVNHLDGGHHLHLEHPQAVAEWVVHAR